MYKKQFIISSSCRLNDSRNHIFFDLLCFNNNNGPEAATGPGRGAAPLHHDSSVATSSSEITLMEENISA